MNNETQTKRRRGRGRLIGRGLVLGLILVSLAGNVLLFVQLRAAQDSNPQVQTERLVNDLRKLTSVPDETPSVVTVVDKSKLTNTTLAQGVENGDKIITFARAGKVYVYRPSTSKLVNIYSLSASKN